MDYTCNQVCNEVGGSMIDYNDLKKLTANEICIKDKSKSFNYSVVVQDNLW